MRRLIVSEFVSIDGVMEAPGGEPGYPHTGWVGDYFGPQHEKFKFQEVLDAGALLLGRVTFESFSGAWPGYEGAFADRMNAMPKYVVSSTIDGDPGWNTSVVDGDAVEGVRRLKEGDGDPLLVNGSRTLAQALLRAGLVDELILMVFPVILGSGFRLYPESPDKLPMHLVDTATFDSGVVNLTFHAT